MSHFTEILNKRNKGNASKLFFITFRGMNKIVYLTQYAIKINGKNKAKSTS